MNDESELHASQSKYQTMSVLSQSNNNAAQSRKNNDEKQYNRKEKSLGELCKRFLCLYGSEDKDLLLLDQCTVELGTERRRIYDIINILESFCVIRR